MSRLPIRLRLTLAFAAAMALVLGTVGLLLYDGLAASLDRTLDQGLRARAADVSALVQQADTGLRQSKPDPFSAPRDGFAQVIDVRGRIFDQTPGLPRSPLLSRGQLAEARRSPTFVERTSPAGEHVRLLGLPITAQDQHLVVVVGMPLGTRDSALASLRSELLVGGPVALLLASLTGYLVAAGALRGVERMRRRAAAISASRLSERLPVPRARDELARLGVTLNAMLERLERALARQRSFVADASHELRTPLAVLRAEIDLALGAPRSREQLREALRSAGEETDRLSRLADDLLLLARLDEGRLPIRTEAIEVDRVLRTVARRFEPRARALGRELEVEAGEPRVEADPLRLEQALGNLVENALRYGAGRIRIAAVEDGGTTELHVTDEGSGFPPGFLDRAFERFSRPDEDRSVAGAGLGLAIVSAIAQAHGGDAHGANRPGGGADVWLALPSGGGGQTGSPPARARAGARAAV